MLCDLCRAFAQSVRKPDSRPFWKWNNDQKWFQYEHGPLCVIEKSARAGCQFCRFFVAAYRWCDPPPEGKDREKPSWISTYRGLNDGVPAWFSFRASSIDSPGRLFELCYVDHIHTPGISDRAEIQIQNDPLLPASIQHARSWLLQCESGHDRCRRKASRLPTRVIDVGDWTTGYKVRLLETHGGTGRYLTLSYCWGPGLPHRTTVENYSSSLSSIRFDDLPKTLKDAIEYTRMLGLRFIWIDSLCIIQDDQNDWKREAAKMSWIYQGATLSLSILDAANCEEGFLLPQTLSKRPENQNDSVTTFLRRPLDNRGHDLALRDSALEKRAWTLQERLLAPAVLDFAVDGLYWQCYTGSASLDEPDIKPLQADVWPIAPMEDKIAFNMRLKMHSGLQAPDAASSWYSLVESYTKRALSRESDRFAAIQGLATRYQSFRSDRYIAGLWSDDLHACMLWQMSREHSSNGHASPSWSWITAGAPVTYEPSPAVERPYKICPRAEISVFSPCSKPIDSRGQGTALHVRGSCRKGTLRWRMRPGAIYMAFQPLGRSDGSIGCRLDAHSAGVRPETASQWLWSDGRWIRPNVYCLLIASQGGNTKQVRDLHLFLEKMDPDTAGYPSWLASEDGDSADQLPCFRRIGYGNGFVRSGEDAFPVDKFMGRAVVGDEEWARALREHQVLESLILI